MSLYGYKRKTKPAVWQTAFPVEREEPKRKRVKPVSDRRRGEVEAYRKAAREFVRTAVRSGGTCPVVNAVPELRDGFKYGHKVSNRLNEVHHVRGRAGALLNDRRHWLALSKQGHRWVHEHPAEAVRLGWLGGPGEWGSVPKIVPDNC